MLIWIIIFLEWYWFCFCKSGISSFHQLLQFDVYFRINRLIRIPTSSVLVFCLSFSFCNLIFVFSFYNLSYVLSDHIISRRYLFSFAIFVQFLQSGTLSFAAFASWFSLFVNYIYGKRWFTLVYECEIGWKELFVLELYNEKFP
jgi:hypothetical protein